MLLMWIIIGICGLVGLISGVEIIRFFLGKSTKLTFLIALVVFLTCLFFVAGAGYVVENLELPSP